MEALYAIISILFFTAVIVVLVLLFRIKGTDSEQTTNKDLGTKVNQVFRGKKNSQPSKKHSSEFYLEHSAPETINETIRDTALDVLITYVRNPQVREVCSIQDDEVLSRDGVVIGRENCDYNMKSLLIDRDGTFLIKRIDDDYTIIANRDSINGIRSEFRGEKKKRIKFKNGKATCYVGSIRFDFSVPGTEADAPAQSRSRKAMFYTDETINEGTQAYSL